MIQPQIADIQLSGPQPDIPFLFPDHSGPILPSSLSVAGVVTPLIFGPATITAVGFRFWAHRQTKAGIAIDAYLILAATILALSICVLTIWASLCAGLGWPLIWLSSPAGLRFQKGLDAGQIVWGVAIASIRASILCFYRRIFSVKKFRIATDIALAINAAWLIVYTIITAVSYVSRGDLQYAISYTGWLIVNGCLDVVQDIIVLCLPLFIISKLKMSRYRKLGLAALFWLGAFCVIASTVRVVLFVKIFYLPDTDRYFADLISECAIWTTIQPCTSIIAACLPTYGPLLRGNSNWFTRLFLRFKTFVRTNRQGTGQYPNQKTTEKRSRYAKQDVFSSWSRLKNPNNSVSCEGNVKVEQVFELEDTAPNSDLEHAP